MKIFSDYLNKENLVNKYQALEPEQRSLIISSIPIAALFAYSYYITAIQDQEQTEKSYFPILAVMFSVLGGQFFVGNLAQTPARDFGKQLSYFLPDPINPNKSYLRLKNFKLEFDKIRSSLTVEQEKKLNLLFEKLKFFNDFFGNGKNEKDIDKEMMVYIVYLEYLFKLLEEKPSANHSATIEEKNNILHGLNNIIATYDDSTRANIKEKVLKPFVSNMYTKTKMPIAPICLIGEPGVGKTRFVESLAKTTNATLVNYKTYKASNRYDAQNWQEEMLNKDKVHFLTNALYQSKISGNPDVILFIDELDKMLDPNSDSEGAKEINLSLLKSLNADLREIEDTYLQINIRIPNILIIAAMNKPLIDVDKSYGALQDRFVEIKFSGLTKKLQLDIVLKFSRKQFAELEIEFLDSDEQEIKNFVNANNNQGVRQVLMQAQGYAANRNANKALFGTIWGQPAQNKTKEPQHLTKLNRKNKALNKLKI